MEKITGIRNIIAHFYWGIDYVQVWDIAKNELPLLRQRIENILAETK